MIPCKEEMKLNKFQTVRVMNSRDLYKRFGQRVKGAQTSEEEANFSRNPIEMHDYVDDSYYEALHKAQLEEKKRLQKEAEEKKKQESAEE